MNKDITLSQNEFNHLLIQAFRYALPRDGTWVSEDMAKYVMKYWDQIFPAFQDQIKRDARSDIEVSNITRKEAIKAWEEVLKL